MVPHRIGFDNLMKKCSEAVNLNFFRVCAYYMHDIHISVWVGAPRGKCDCDTYVSKVIHPPFSCCRLQATAMLVLRMELGMLTRGFVLRAFDLTSYHRETPYLSADYVLSISSILHKYRQIMSHALLALPV